MKKIILLIAFNLFFVLNLIGVQRKEIIIPKGLKQGSTIGLVAPANYTGDSVQYEIEYLINKGFNIIYGNSFYSKWYGFGGNDDIRAQDINDMFKNKNIDAIFAVRGGYGSIRFVDKLDYDTIKKNPKIFMGFSDITTLLIVGIAISSFLGAFTSFSMYLIGQDSFRIVTWMMGYIGAASWGKIFILIIPLFISVIYFYLKRHDLDLLLSGDEESHSMGVDVGKLKKNTLIISALIVGFSVAFTGMIGFVGLIAPHTVRLLTKSSSNTKLIPLSTLGGGLFLLICDTIGRTLLSPIEIPIGVVTAFFGAPFFLYLAMKRKKGG